MNSPDSLEAAERRMYNALLAYTERDRQDAQLHERLLDELRAATTEFLEARVRWQHLATNQPSH